MIEKTEYKPRCKSPVKWFGGKGNMIAKLRPLIPEHKVYVEPFCGGASMFFCKAPGGLEVINDLDEGLTNFYRVLRDPELFPKLLVKLMLTPYSRPEFNRAKKTWEREGDPLEKAYLWFVVIRQSFNGSTQNGWGSVVSSIERNMAKTCCNWQSVIADLFFFHERLMQCQVEQQDWRTILNRYDSKDTFFYLDPPYVLSSRRSGGYLHELADSDHVNLIERIKRLEGKVLLSGYPNEIYDALPSDRWNQKRFVTSCHAVARTKATGLTGKGAVNKNQPRTEVVWFNYSLN